MHDVIAYWTTTRSVECEASRRVTSTRAKSDRILTHPRPADGPRVNISRLSPPKVYRRESTGRDTVSLLGRWRETPAPASGISSGAAKRGAGVTTESHYPLGLSRGLLLGSRSPRRVRRKALPTEKYSAETQERVARRGEGRRGKGLRESRVPRLPVISPRITPVEANGLMTSAGQFFRSRVGVRGTRRLMSLSLSLGLGSYASR